MHYVKTREKIFWKGSSTQKTRMLIYIFTPPHEANAQAIRIHTVNFASWVILGSSSFHWSSVVMAKSRLKHFSSPISLVSLDQGIEYGAFWEHLLYLSHLSEYCFHVFRMPYRINAVKDYNRFDNASISSLDCSAWVCKFEIIGEMTLMYVDHTVNY